MIEHEQTFRIRYVPPNAKVPLFMYVRNADEALQRARALAGFIGRDSLLIIDDQMAEHSLAQFEERMRPINEPGLQTVA